MDAKEYLQKCVSICNVFEPDGCVNCPLKQLACGAPKETDEQEKVLPIVEAFTAPPQKHICPRCKNEEHATYAKFCIICGLKIGEREPE